MNCREFETLLEALIDGDLAVATRESCLRHARGCQACNELLIAVGGTTPNTRRESAPDLATTVLERTIGAACRQAHEQLPAFVDQELASADRELVDVHLKTCIECRSLASTLVALRRELPRLADVPPDERFADEVLAATLPPGSRWKRWWSDRWSHWIRRPRFAMEAAYVGLLVVILVLGAVGTPVSAFAQQSLRLVGTDPETPTVWTTTNEYLGTFWERVASLFERAQTSSTEESP